MKTIINLLFPQGLTPTHYLIGALCLFIFSVFAFVVYKVIKTERKATTQRKAMKVGDIVYYHYAAESSIEGVVTAIDGDDVTIQTTKVISMSRVYPVN